MTMTKKIYISTLLLLTLGLGNADAQMSRHQKNLLFEADIYYTQGDYYYAAELYTELAKVSPKDGELLGKLGICYFNLPPLRQESQRYLKLAVEYGDTESMYYLAKRYAEEYRFIDALRLLDSYANKADRTRSAEEIAYARGCAERAKQMVQAPLGISIHNLGDQVNSPLHDYAPVWDRNGNRIYFTSRRRYDNTSEKDISEQYDENIFVLDLKSESPAAVAAPEPLNTRMNDAAVACSNDGSSLMIFRTRKDGYSGDLYEAQKNIYSWTNLEKLAGDINTKYHETSATYGSVDESVLIISSDRPGGYGGKDLYRIQKLPNGDWGQAENLGPDINSTYDEDGPFVSADGTLYFASKGHTTIGGYDIFSAPILNNGWGSPRNMGYPINTPGDDIFFVIDPTGITAYFSSERIGGFGLQDIYRATIDEATTIIYHGELVSGDTPLGHQARVSLINESNGKVEGIFRTDPQEQSFVLALHTNKTYTLVVEAEGYRTFEKTVFFEEIASNPEEIRERLSLSK